MWNFLPCRTTISGSKNYFVLCLLWNYKYSYWTDTFLLHDPFRTSIFCIDCNHCQLGIFYSLNHLSGYMEFPRHIVSHFNYISYMRKSTFTGPKKIFCSLCIVQFPNIFTGPTHFSTRHGLSTGFFHTDGRTNNLDMNQHPLFVWVLSLLGRYFHHSNKENLVTMITVLCRNKHSNWQSTEAFLYIIGKSNIMLTWNYFTVLCHLRKTQFQTLLLIHVVEIPTQKGEHSWKCTELSLKLRETQFQSFDFIHIIEIPTNKGANS